MQIRYVINFLRYFCFLECHPLLSANCVLIDSESSRAVSIPTYSVVDRICSTPTRGRPSTSTLTGHGDSSLYAKAVARNCHMHMVDISSAHTRSIVLLEFTYKIYFQILKDWEFQGSNSRAWNEAWDDLRGCTPISLDLSISYISLRLSLSKFKMKLPGFSHREGDSLYFPVFCYFTMFSPSFIFACLTRVCHENFQIFSVFP